MKEKKRERKREEKGNIQTPPTLRRFYRENREQATGLATVAIILD
jgi:hypothetical protein